MIEATIVFRAKLISSATGERVAASVEVPDLGSLTRFVHPSGGDPYYFAQWVDADGKLHALAVQRLEGFAPGPPNQFFFVGSARSEATVDAIKEAIGLAAFRGPEALVNGPAAQALAAAGVRRLLRKSTGQPASYIPPHVIAGHDPIVAAVPLGENPEDFEAEDA